VEVAEYFRSEAFTHERIGERRLGTFLRTSRYEPSTARKVRNASDAELAQGKVPVRFFNGSPEGVLNLAPLLDGRAAVPSKWVERPVRVV
jgi:hypothetical protein